MAVIVLLALTSLGALVLVACGAPASAVREVLEVLFPPLVALAATTIAKDRWRS